ncbi:MAG: ferrochelatase [Slackia sp.]|nr:ferrochelatase [Slackia sp.]
MLGILLMNTGTPDAPTPEAIRPYLKEFLSDRNVVDMPAFIWQPILNLFILPKRPKKTAPRYREFWAPEGSPFVIDSLAQCAALEKRLASLSDEPVVVRLGMRYGNPSIEAGLRELCDAGVDRIVGLPLYPQNTRACTGTCREEFERCIDRIAPEGLRRSFVDEYWNAPGYIEALAASVRRSWAHAAGSKLVVSFHSVPVSFAKRGDTYVEATKATARLLAEALGLSSADVLTTYQSRFDSRKWQGPLLVPELERLAREGVRDVAVVCPGFSVDCIETSFEVGIEAAEAYRAAAQDAGVKGARFTYIPALGADNACMDALSDVVMRAACACGE